MAVMSRGIMRPPRLPLSIVRHVSTPSSVLRWRRRASSGWRTRVPHIGRTATATSQPVYTAHGDIYVMRLASSPQDVTSVFVKSRTVGSSGNAIYLLNLATTRIQGINQATPVCPPCLMRPLFPEQHVPRCR